MRDYLCGPWKVPDRPSQSHIVSSVTYRNGYSFKAKFREKCTSSQAQGPCREIRTSQQMAQYLETQSSTHEMTGISANIRELISTLFFLLSITPGDNDICASALFSVETVSQKNLFLS